ncbi:6686_t:CDS:2, partial [Gigaspora margarita]
MLEPKNLALDLIKGIYNEVLTKKKLEKEKNPTFKTYQKFTEPKEKATDLYVDMPGTETSIVAPKDQSHVISILNVIKKHLPSKPTTIKVLDTYYDLDKPVGEPFDDTGEISTKKGKEKNYNEIVDIVKVLMEKEKLDHACELWLKNIMKFREMVGCNRNNRTKGESQYLNEHGAEIGDGKSKKVRDEDGTIERLIRINEESTNGLVKFRLSRRRDIVKSLKELDPEEESEVDESDNVDNIDETSKKDRNEKNDKKGINKKKQNRASKEWIKKIEKLQGKSKWNKEVKRRPEGKLAETNDMPNAGNCYRYKIWESTNVSNDEEGIEVRRHYQDEIEVKIYELYKWHFGSTKEDNLASQFDPGGLCWQKSQLKKIRKEKLVGNNDNNNNGVEKSMKRRGLLWNRRLQISYKKMDDLHKPDREAIQNIKYDENGELVMLKVGD